MLRTVIILCITLLNIQGKPNENNESWSGKWFPNPPDEPDTNPQINITKSNLHDHKHGIAMGIIDTRCDDAKANLKVDWYMNPENFTCVDDKTLYLPDKSNHPIHSSDQIPKLYSAPHKCMNESIEYSENIPTFGPHRPLWAVYGEYKFLPKQRWLHNLEHGGIAMLYHPCANKREVNLLRKIVRSCLYKHVITPYNMLTTARPLALVSWGHRLEISKVYSQIVIDFIRKHAIKGPEATPKDGQYTLLLENPAKVVSDINDSNLCPNQDGLNMK